jgi:hypothetical protein
VSQLGPLLLFTSVIEVECLKDTSTWSIWLTSFDPGTFHVPRFILLCGNVLFIFNPFLVAN